jgi:hypothetical protein
MSSGFTAGGFSPDQQTALAVYIEAAIMHSFKERQSRMTRFEVTRRFKMCETIVDTLRFDAHWSAQRICDHLYQYLLASIDGTSWVPSTGSRWGTPS